ncbi:MAG: thermostable hemolysin [bacterium]|jgi:hypothetical protein|nr:thermostable hemolysin [Betaproteobacteria bacterium]
MPAVDDPHLPPAASLASRPFIAGHAPARLVPSAPATTGAAPARRVATAWRLARMMPRLEPLLAEDEGRADLEGFIAGVFLQRHGAHTSHYAASLLGLRGQDGGWCAALGYTRAPAGGLFVEHYLDRPVEQAVAAVLGEPVDRSTLAEVGNLAASADGLGRLLIALTTVHLFEQGVQHVVFTATRALSNAFARLGVPLVDMGPADPARVPGGEANWGDYYRHDPRILAGRVASGLPVAGRLPD